MDNLHRDRRMDERDKRRVGEQIAPGGRPKAPGRLELLQRFVNTWNHEFPASWDRLETAEKARTWLARRGLASPGARVTSADAARLRTLREAIRALVVANHGSPPDAAAVRTVRREGRGATLRIRLDGGGHTSLAPGGRDVDSAVATLLAVLHEAQLTGAWRRLKACRRCRYAFFDRSKNRSSAWCAMSICGNRTKNRTYRRRRSATTRTTRSS
jgi:predicted RNA-binding Zn ribbon-like protein